MECRPLDITVISAEDLKDVNLISKMDVYVVVSISNDPKSKRRTHVDKDGGKNPKWNHPLNFSLDQAALSHQPYLSLTFNLKSQRPFGDRDIGEVTVPIKELLDNYTAAAGGSERVVEYQVRTPSGKPKGTLKFAYKFGEKFTTKSKNVNEPVTAYPAQAGSSAAYPPPPAVWQAPPPPPGMGVPYAHQAGYPPQQAYGYPPPPPAYGGGYPPASAYGYPPQGYGYPPAMQQPQMAKKKKNNNFGLGLGAGLLGGLLVGDMISDVGDMAAYDAGYDAGFDDSGFDF